MTATTQASAALAVRGLKPIGELAAGRAHGDRLRYMAGCRCVQCRAANSRYENERRQARKKGDWNGNVSCEKARSHILALAAAGVGKRSISAASDVALSIIHAIRVGTKPKIRARTETRILAVTVAAAADNALVPAGPTWALLDVLLKAGYTKAYLDRRLGNQGRALQLSKVQVTVRHAYQVERLFEELRPVAAHQTLKRIEELRDEGFTKRQIDEHLQRAAERLGYEKGWRRLKSGRVASSTAKVVEQVHRELTA